MIDKNVYEIFEHIKLTFQNMKKCHNLNLFSTIILFFNSKLCFKINVYFFK